MIVSVLYVIYDDGESNVDSLVIKGTNVVGRWLSMLEKEEVVKGSSCVSGIISVGIDSRTALEHSVTVTRRWQPYHIVSC